MTAVALARRSSGPAGGAGTFVYRHIASTVAPQLFDSLAFLKNAWPATQALSGAERTAAEIAVLEAFFSQLGDPTAVFRKIDAAIAALAAAPAAAAGGFGAVAGGTVGGIVGAVVAGPPGAAVGVAAGAVAGAVQYAAIAGAVTGLIASLEPLGLADTIPDDEGLKASVMALKQRYDASRALGPLSPEFSRLGAGSDAGMIGRMLEEIREVAAARVEFERLRCHLGQNLPFYMQGVWSQLKDYELRAILAANRVPGRAVEARITGFVGDLGAFRVTDAQWLKKEGGLDWKALEKELASRFEAPRQDIVELPTQGMTVEAQVGQCSAGEQFIEDHRALDVMDRRAEVDIRIAEAAQAQQEAKRFEARIKKGELDDPTPFEHASVQVTVDKP
jgi:hypothetical protein